MDLSSSSYFSVELSPEAFASVNVPVSVFSIILNIFFVSCMVFPHKRRERLKPPLTILLGLLVKCNIAAHICIVAIFLNNFFQSFFVRWCVPPIAINTMMISINSSQWLNVFYCFQIIPVQRLYFVWLKKNLRIFISSALIVSAVVCLLGMSVNIADIEILFRYNDTDPKTDWIHLVNAQKSGFYMTLGLFCLSLCVMLASSSTTVVFLWRHLKNVGKNSGSFSSPRRQRHIRVTVISIVVQALLHVICSALVIIDELVIYVSPWYFDLGNNILCTIVSLYSFGTTINMSVSQSLFRQRTVYVWQKLFLPHSSSSVSTITQSPI